MKTRVAPSPAADGIHPHLSASLKAQWKRCRKELKRCRRHCSEEAVHDLRVETRRLLSAVELVGAFIRDDRLKKGRKLLKQHLDTFADLRDAQVQCLSAARLAPRSAAAALFHSSLVRRRQRAARKAQRRLRRLAPARLGRLLEHFRDALRERRKQGRGEHDCAAVLRAVGRAFDVTARRRERLDPADTDPIHRTRIAFKKFRYMVEALAPLLPGVNASRLRAMHNYQGMMGRIQDAEVLLRSYDDFRKDEDLDSPSSRAFRTQLERQRRRLIQFYLRRADQLSRFWPLSAALTAKAPNP